MESSDREWAVKLQFLDEAKDYLNSIESELLGFSDRGNNRQALDKILRAAHSIKGGSAMMGFMPLSQTAHRIEDFFKILQVNKTTAIATEVEQSLLQALDGMKQLATRHAQKLEIEETWLQIVMQPPLAKLYELLGDLTAQDEAAILSAETGQDMRILMFETEVDACLARLEAVLANPNSALIREEFLIASQELGCLGEILELPVFAKLCQDAAQLIESSHGHPGAIAQTILSTWRRSQDLVLIGQFDLIPIHFDISSLEIDNHELSQISQEAQILDIDQLFSLDFGTTEGLSEVQLEIPATEIEQFANLFSDRPEAEITEFADFSLDFLEVESPKPKVATEVIPTKETIQEPATTSELNLRIPARYLTQLSDRFGELNAERNSLRLQLQRMRELVELLGTRVQGLEQSNSRLRTAYDRTSMVSTPTLAAVGNVSAPKAIYASSANNSSLAFANQFDALEMDQYSEMHLLSREIMDSVVQLQEVTGDIETALEDSESTSRELGRSSRQMQASLEQARMRPLSDIFSRFPRVLRELSFQHGKQVELSIRGGSTLVERSVLDILQDPLLHLIRNAFDHGIEDPQTRQAHGKSSKGAIAITAVYRGNQTIITLADDGSGINLAKVRAKAAEMGLSQTELENASEPELLALIFEPGFSTATQVTELSGRGVGMDVVRSNLREIGGDVRVETIPNQGTSFTLLVPVSLSIVRVLLLETNGLQIAVLVSAIEEMLLLSTMPIKPNQEQNQELIEWQGYDLPLIRLGDRLKFNRTVRSFQNESRPIIDHPLVLIVNRQDRPYAIQIDRYWGEQEVSTRNISSYQSLPQGFSSCAVLGGGRIVPLIDIESLIDWAIAPQIAKPISPIPLLSDQPMSVMIVDDSINVRRFLAMTLEKAGYRVEQAKDGQEAIEKLQATNDVGIVICDIEMPRLDGFGFLAQSREQPNCRDIPVVMLTSRSGTKHRELAMRLGASAYFAKPFKEQELLKTLSQLIRKK